jgi:hypothetical protein
MKDLSIIRFRITFALKDKHWLFYVRKHHSPDPRFEGTLTSEAENPVQFVMVRTSIGKWSITGDPLPSEINEHVQEIGKAFEKKSSRLKNHHSSESNPGVKGHVTSARTKEKANNGPGT